jgi:hypothetical protein
VSKIKVFVGRIDATAANHTSASRQNRLFLVFLITPQGFVGERVLMKASRVECGIAEKPQGICFIWNEWWELDHIIARP